LQAMFASFHGGGAAPPPQGATVPAPR